MPTSEPSFPNSNHLRGSLFKLLEQLDCFLASPVRFVLELNKLDCTVIICAGVGDTQLRHLARVPTNTGTLSTWSFRLWKLSGTSGNSGRNLAASGDQVTPSILNILDSDKTFRR